MKNAGISKRSNSCASSACPSRPNNRLRSWTSRRLYWPSVYQNGINLITIIANIIEPEPLGLLYLYGVQGVAETIDRAKEIAHDGYLGFAGAMQGSFRVLEMRCINAEETEWLREKMYGMDYLTVVRGIPKANDGGEDAGNKGMGGRNINPDSQGTLEEIIVGMADYEYIIEILSTPVYKSTLEEWSARTERDMTDWQGQLQGTKSFSFNLSIPMMFSNNQSTSEGWNRAYTGRGFGQLFARRVRFPRGLARMSDTRCRRATARALARHSASP